MTMRHGKIPDWYNKESKHYDAFNEENSKKTNAVIEKILKKYKVKTVFDLTCGTGSQVFYLAQRGYHVTGSDISTGMLKVAKQKAKKNHMDVTLLRGDMRNINAGKFDAALTIFNAIGHLTKASFAKAMRNIHKNLQNDGIYIFDIFNSNYLLQGDNITKLSIEWIKTIGDTKLREVQHSTIDHTGLLVSYTTDYVQKGLNKPKISKGIGTLQLYTANELEVMLKQNGFKVLGQYDIDGSRFSDKKSERILTVARKTE